MADIKSLFTDQTGSGSSATDTATAVTSNNSGGGGSGGGATPPPPVIDRSEWHTAFEIFPWLYLSGHHVAANRAQLTELKITHILNVSVDNPPAEWLIKDRSLEVMHVPLPDEEQYDLKAAMDDTYAFLETARKG